MALTIPREVVDRVTARAREEYVRDFGGEALSDDVRPLSREEAVRLYARDLRFWRARLPQDPAALRGDIEKVALHALCSNAEARLLARAKELGVEAAVRDEARGLT